MKNVIKLAKGSFNNIFQDSLNKILSQQLTHDRSYLSSRNDPQPNPTRKEITNNSLYQYFQCFDKFKVACLLESLRQVLLSRRFLLIKSLTKTKSEPSYKAQIKIRYQRTCSLIYNLCHPHFLLRQECFWG